MKSLGGQRLQTVEVGAAGLFGDRGWGIFEPSTGTVLTARRVPDLLFASARLEADDELVITLPDRTETASDAVLSAWLKREVQLVKPTGAEGATYENPMDVENEADWVSWQGPGWSFHDSRRSALSIVGTESLGPRDIRRFRTNVLVEGGGEDALVGHKVRLGGALLNITKQIDRCIMVSRAQPGIDRDLGVLKDIIRTRNNLFSVGALVVEGGTVAVGDTFGAAADA